MKKLGSKWLAAAALVSGLGVVSGAQAAWDLDCPVATSCTDASSIKLNSVTGVANDSASGAKWVTHSLVSYYDRAPNPDTGGYGMTTASGSSTPAHAIDNQIATEAVLLNFNTSVALSQISIGYKSGDADISVWRYIGGATSSPIVGVGSTAAELIAANWELVGNYGDLAVDTTSPYVNTVNASAKGSSWWLISAYNAGWGAATSGTVNAGDDYFKLFAVAGSAKSCTYGSGTACGDTSKTPEPASLALVAVGMVGALSVRRRRAAKSAGAI